MDAQVAQLVTLLDREIELVAELHAALGREADAIMLFDAAALSQARESKQRLSAALQQCEGQRVALVEGIAAAGGWPSTTPSLSEIAQRLDQPELRRCHLRLREWVPRVQYANRSNQVLLTHALETVRGSLALLGRLGPTTTVYCRSGRVENRGLQGTMLSNAL
jgi:flagellar biosynthesis/type III secretory pathway chaperone